MIHIGGNKLVFKKSIVGIFSAEGVSGNLCCEHEYVTEPPYKAYVVAIENNDNECKAYFTSLSVRTLLSRLNNAR